MEPPSEYPFLSIALLAWWFDPVTVLALVIIAILLVGSAAFSASEVALFSLGPVQLRDLRDRGGTSGERVIDLLSRPRRLLATILIANNFVNVGIIVLSTIAVNGMVDTVGMPAWLIFGIQVVSVTFLILLMGEVVPKVYATNHAMKVAQAMAGPLVVLRWICTPLNEPLIRSTLFIEKRFRKVAGRTISVDTLGHALELTNDASTTVEEQRILKGIIKFGTIEVRQVMRPRTQMVAFNMEMNYAELMKAIVGSGFSRAPVYEGTLDHVVGVLHIKDVLPHLEATEMNWHELLRDPYFVPENKKLDDLLKEFQAKKVHIAMVVDEYGGTSGLITLEDVIEEIVGDITDEFDDEDLVYSKLDDHTYVFEGKTPLNDMYRILGIDGDLFEDNKGDSETIGGFILELTGRIPKRGERVTLRDHAFVVESSDNKRVRRVKVFLGHED